MGNKNTTSSLRNAIIYLNISADRISAKDDKFWNKIFLEESQVTEEVLKEISTQEIRMLRDGSPRNFSLLVYKMVERLNQSTTTLCNTNSQQLAVLNAIRVLTRVIPCIFEDKSWRNFFQTNRIVSTADEYNLDKLLRFPEKSYEERNYTSYLPNTPSQRAVSIELNNESGNDDDDDDGGNEDNDDEDENRYNDRGKLDNSLDGGRVEVDLLLGGMDILEVENKLSIVDKTIPTTTRSGSPQSQKKEMQHDDGATDNLMRTMLSSICDLLFCPEFTVLPHGNSYLSDTVDAPPEDLKSLSTYDYVWEPGVGFESSINSTTSFDKNRSELLKALLVCLSGTLYEKPEKSLASRNLWMEIFVGRSNRHTLPLFTSLLNVIFIYNPNRSMIQQLATTASSGSRSDQHRETLLGLCVHLLLATLDYNHSTDSSTPSETSPSVGENDTTRRAITNTFIDYMSRIHRDEDFAFLVRGFTRLLNAKLRSSGSSLLRWGQPSRQLELDLELMLLFWRICNLNKRFMLYLLRSNETLDVVVPILFHLNRNFQDPSRTALIHLGVFNLLILSGERNFGVKLNKVYSSSTGGSGGPAVVLENLPEFSGSHADLMVMVFHKLIMYGYKINQLYDYLLNILVNISPYLKSLTTLASRCLIQLFETFSSPFVIFTEPNYHQLVIFLLEIFNNMIQYQFDSNANLIYVIISKRDLFNSLAGMSTNQTFIDKVLKKLIKRKMQMKQMQKEALESSMAAATVEKTTAEDTLTPTTSTNICDNIFDFDLATVSCDLCQHNSISSRQEVSLVATPDIHHCTHPTHPFINNEISTTSESDLVTASCLQRTKSPAPPPPTPSLDDLLMRRQPSDETESEFLIPGLELVDGNRRHEQTKESSSVMSKNEHKRGQEDDDADDDDSNNDTDTGNSKIKKWRPTSKWLVEWKQTLPMQTVLRMINVLMPQIEQLKQQSSSRLDEQDVIRFLQNGTLVGLLPVPHPILIRKYRTNEDSTIWFRVCTWAIIYVKSTAWMSTDIRLIRIL